MIWLAVLVAAIGAGWLSGHGDAVINARLATSAAPEGLLLSMMGVTMGLYGRDRIRLRRAYASPTLAYLGKRALLASAVAAGTFVMSPVAWPPETLDVAAASSALGWAVWVGNLPVRL